jgi:hypothetical protein
MRANLLAALVFSCGAACGAAEFQPPVMLKAGDAAIRVESPGYACPSWAEVGGKMSLVVGQFNGGKMRAYPHLGGLKFGPGKWIEADGKVAEVPGVW